MLDTMTSTATTLDIAVLPDSNIRYESLAPTGRPHVAYLVVVTEPTPRESDDAE
ncbi:MAG: hypothetical protein QOI25_1102 [Mycobacterium sp.]|jgi:hypothetical protein|nr:hypothetical protein [Mycobacterium sp.]